MKRILFILFFFLSFNTFAQQNQDRKEVAKFYGLSDSALAIWRNDSTGCLVNRPGVFHSLFTKEKLLGMPKNHFFLLFGMPNEEGENGIIVYRIGIFCDSNFRREPETSGWNIIVTILDNKVFDYIIEIIE